MRDLTDENKIYAFMRAFGRLAKSETAVFFTGGVTAVLVGWRDTTVDIDLKMVPELDELFRGIPQIKEGQRVNIELASPSDFIPELPGWRDRSIYIGREGKVTFYNYDPYSQALSKLERGHEKDLLDIDALLNNNMIDPVKLMSLFLMIEPLLYKYPAIDPATFAESVQRFVARSEKDGQN